MNIQDLFPLGLTGWISLQSKGLSRAFSNTTVQKHQFFGASLLYGPALTSIHECWKTIALTRRTFVGKVMSLLFNMLSRLVITFLLKSKRLLISLTAVTICSDFGAPQNKVSHWFSCFPIYFPWSAGTRCHDLLFLDVEFQASSFTLLFHFQEALQFFAFCYKGGVICVIWRFLLFLPAILIPAVLH